MNPRRRRLTGVWACLLATMLAASARAQQPLVPAAFELGEAASLAMEAPWLTDEERSELRLFHGVWDDRDLTTPTARAIVALNAWDFDHPALADESVPPEIRAEAMFLKGDLEGAVALLEGATIRASARAARITAEALEALGRHDEANAAVDTPVALLLAEQLEDASELTEAVRALFVRARVLGQPGKDFRTMMTLLSRAHQKIDRLHYPAMLAEAELLLEKDNMQEAVAALHAALSLNPRSSEAWYMLGRVAIGRFDFESAATAARALRRMNPAHPLATLLEAETRLIEDDPEDAIIRLEALIKQRPALREAHALLAAAYAVAYDDERTQAALDAYEALSPGSAYPYYVVGRHLAFDRQYGPAADALEESVRRQPKWPTPQIELGLLELQSGRDLHALDALRDVVELDPFNKRAANSLLLLEEMADYERVETEHFIIRYKPGIDKVFVDTMPEKLEAIHHIVATRFEHEPAQKTVIEVLPDHERFAVRITSMPHIHTIAACTGPVLAMEVPREGPPNKHLGPFDWPRVFQHEYTHTVTLSQTKNRIPHWLTEAAAVSMEPAPRDYSTVQLLSHAYLSDELFTLKDINWGFIRPRKPTDRSLAYAQGHWMLLFMNERFGDSALIRLLQQYFDGEREETAVPNALNISRDAFYEEFLIWAGEQVKSWGMAPEPTLEQLADDLRWADDDLAAQMVVSQQARLDLIVKSLTERVGEPADVPRPLEGDDWPSLVKPKVDITDEVIDEWLAEHPDHPDLIELKIRRRMRRVGPHESLIPLLEQYAIARPVDPFPHRVLAQIKLAGDDPAQATLHLEYLDVRAQKSTAYAIELARLYRQQERFDSALDKIDRAVNINPYHAPTRETAAGIAIQSGRLDVARRHIFALTLIEPDRPRHARRLERIDQIITERGG